MTDFTKPQLGHLRLTCRNNDKRSIEVTWPSEAEGFIRLWMTGEASLCAPLTAKEARQIAHALIICAARLDSPNAVAGHAPPP